jgi:protein-tyrosine phosphatase
VSVVLEALGIDRDVILADFLRSNEAVPQLRERILEQIRTRGENGSAGDSDGVDPEALTFAEARLTEEVLGVKEQYLAAARRSIDENYGSVSGYLEAAGVSADDVTRLRAVLLD